MIGIVFEYKYIEYRFGNKEIILLYFVFFCENKKEWYILSE